MYQLRCNMHFADLTLFGTLPGIEINHSLAHHQGQVRLGFTVVFDGFNVRDAEPCKLLPRVAELPVGYLVEFKETACFVVDDEDPHRGLIE